MRAQQPNEIVPKAMIKTRGHGGGIPIAQNERARKLSDPNRMYDGKGGAGGSLGGEFGDGFRGGVRG